MVEQHAKMAKIDQLKEKLDELLNFVLGRSNIHGGIRLLIIQNQELLAEAQAEEAGKLAAAVKRADAAEARAEAAKLVLREKSRRSLPTPLAAVAGTLGGTPSGTNQPGTGKRHARGSDQKEGQEEEVRRRRATTRRSTTG